MSRIKKLETYYHEQLKEHKVKDISDFIQFIVDADITKGKYARFLIDAFLNEKFLEEDLIGGLDSTVGRTISLFDKHKGKLPLEQRSVYALDEKTDEMLYQSPGDLWKAVKQYQGELSGKELKKEEQEKIYRETEFVYKDEETGFQIVSPLTEESAKWWGKGTRWCTSAENNNQFEQYAKKAPLFILLMPARAGTTKLQLWRNGNEVQFMDEADSAVSLDYIEQHWTILEPICFWLNDLQFIPDKYLTAEVCKLAVSNNGFSVYRVPEDLITKELYKLAIQQNGMALGGVPDKFFTKQLCELAIQQNGSALRYIPDNNIYNIFQKTKKTPELCKLAVKQNGCALYYVPQKYMTKELCELAVKQSGEALRYIPKEYMTKELCELAVKNNRMALLYIPKEYMTKELCELDVKQNGWTLECIPKELHKSSSYYKEKYQETYQELKECFPINSLSLDSK